MYTNHCPHNVWLAGCCLWLQGCEFRPLSLPAGEQEQEQTLRHPEPYFTLLPSGHLLCKVCARTSTRSPDTMQHNRYMTEHLQNHYDIKMTVECVGCARVIGSYHHSGGARRSYNKHKQSCERYKLLLQQPTSDEIIDNETGNNSNDEAETSSSKEATRGN